MGLKYNKKSGYCNRSSVCNDKYGCPDGVCPHFTIRRHDTKPALKVSIENCDGPMDFHGLVIEANMWANAKLKNNISENDEYFQLADNVGFDQLMVGDLIFIDQVRMPEQMLIVGFDEHEKYVKVIRGYHGTTAGVWKKGTSLRIFRVLNGEAQSEMIYEDIQNVDGTTTKDVIQESSLIYEWQPRDTCLPGCYWLEFKVLKMIDIVWYLPGGYWAGEKFQDSEGFFNTGSVTSDSQVRLSFDQAKNKYRLPSTVWNGDIHQHTDDAYYTGSVHTDGSVLLSKDGPLLDKEISYDEEGTTSFHNASNVSFTPSFTSSDLTELDFGCTLGEGVEWVRRFPTEGEGYLIKIEFSPTTELGAVSSGGSGGSDNRGVEHHVADSAPSNPYPNDLWFNTTNGKMYIYYNDGDSNQWVEI